ncbi:hypothetical protein V6N11_025591 [Hibiscus sabdariffa]|uniref:Uncharacterized protein n=1 Tax=Hibiscus sabdariffa TaxID=183260 RepID=A0ABR2ST47_9ROSI
MMRHLYSDLSTSLGVGLRYDKRDKGRYDVDQEFKGRKSEGAAEFTCKILDFQRDQDVRLKVGYEGLEKVPYLQIRENNWTLSADMNGRWNLEKGRCHFSYMCVPKSLVMNHRDQKTAIQ